MSDYECPACGEIACLRTTMHDIEAGLIDISVPAEDPKPLTAKQMLSDTLDVLHEGLKRPIARKVLVGARGRKLLRELFPAPSEIPCSATLQFAGIPIVVDETVREGTAELVMSDGSRILIVGL